MSTVSQATADVMPQIILDVPNIPPAHLEEIEFLYDDQFYDDLIDACGGPILLEPMTLEEAEELVGKATPQETSES